MTDKLTFNKELYDKLNNQLPQIKRFMETGEDTTEGVQFVEPMGDGLIVKKQGKLYSFNQ